MNKYAYYIDEPMSIYRYFSDNSWTINLLTRNDSNEKVISLRKNIIEILNSLNDFTDKKY